MESSTASGTAPAMAAGGSELSTELRKRIEIMAEHLSKNGPGFETMVKAKNANNPQFSFLYSGEGHEYFQQVLAQMRSGTFNTGPSSAPTAPSSSGSSPSMDSDTTAAYLKWKEPPVYPMSSEAEKQVDELISTLETTASRDLIRNSRQWVETNTSMAAQIAGLLMKRLAYLKTTMHRLHVLYLVHDVLQTEATSKSSSRLLIAAFKPYLVWMLRPCYQMALKATDDEKKNDDEAQKVLRLVTLWHSREILDQRQASEIRLLVTAKELPDQKFAVVPSGSGTSSKTGGVSGVPGVVGPGGLSGVFPGGVPGGMMAPRPGMPAMGQMVGARPGMMSGAGGLRPPMQPGIVPGAGSPQGGGKTPETVPVGIMAQMMKEISQRAKNLQTAFVPYRPLDPMFTPQSLPPDQPPSQKLLLLLDDFYRQVSALDERQDLSPDPVRSRSRSRSRSPKKKSLGPAPACAEEEKEEQEQEAEKRQMTPGTRVKLHSLKTQALNGLQGELVEFIADSGRWRCIIIDGKDQSTKDLKPENLFVIEE